MQIINKAYHKVQSSKFKVQSKMKALTKTDFHFDGQKSGEAQPSLRLIK